VNSIDIIQFFLLVITITMVAGFAGVVYYLGKIYLILARPEYEGSTGGTGTPGEPSRAGPAPLRREIDPWRTGSLEESLGAITRKYGLASFTLATADGLLIGSTKKDAEDEAARCSYLYTQGRVQDETGVELFGIPHCGETVIGIACPSEPLSTELTDALEQDTRDVLNHWA